ncbi:MAG TPA: Hsp20/alpha crystallin family protein [Xanthobacteraceae bacterium]
MNLRSLMPLRDRGGLARPEATPFVFGSLQREVDRLFEEFTRGLPMLASPGMMNIVPKVDVTETDKEIEITVELPGLERKDVEISVEDDVLTIRGEKSVESEEGDQASQPQTGKQQSGRQQGAQAQASQAQGSQSQIAKKNNGGSNKSYHLSERSYGVFVRMLQLPPGIDPSTIQATMSNGVLKIKIPKPERSQAKKIEVKEAA